MSESQPQAELLVCIVKDHHQVEEILGPMSGGMAVAMVAVLINELASPALARLLLQGARA